MEKAIYVVAALVPIFAGVLPVHAHRSHVIFRGGIWIGPGWGSWWWVSQAYPYYVASPLVVQQQPSTYVGTAPQQEQQS